MHDDDTINEDDVETEEKNVEVMGFEVPIFSFVRKKCSEKKYSGPNLLSTVKKKKIEYLSPFRRFEDIVLSLSKLKSGVPNSRHFLEK